MCARVVADMLTVGVWCRRSLRVGVLLLLVAELPLMLDARPTRTMLRRGHHHGAPRHAAVVADAGRAAAGSAVPGRWTAPCAGGTTADTPVGEPSSTTDDADDVTSQHGRRRLLRRLARQMSRLADRVDRLKLRYVSSY